jgi:hypothetical protein
MALSTDVLRSARNCTNDCTDPGLEHEDRDARLYGIPRDGAARESLECGLSSENPGQKPSQAGALHDFATLTLRCELVHLAQRLLDGPPEFAVRRAMELAGLVLTLGTKARATEGSPGEDQAGDGPMPGCDIAEGKGSTK